MTATTRGPIQDPARKFFKISELAELFGVIVQTVHYWVKTGRIRQSSGRRSGAATGSRGRRSSACSPRRAARWPGLWERVRVRVLLIDDDPGIRRMLRDAARSPAFPMKVDSAETVEDGMLLAAQFQPEVILLDTFFSHDLLNGEEGVAFIRHAKLLQNAGVVAMVDDARSAARMTKAGADAILVKPFDLAELRTVIYRQWKARATTTRA
jgi:CheY-like chemotaxis protein